MSRPDLFDLAIQHGGMDLIPEDLCRIRRIGRDRVWNVFVTRLLYADSSGVNWIATRTLAARLRGVDRVLIQQADAVLEEAGLMVRDGKRGNAIRWRMMPAILAQEDAEHRDPPDPSGGPVGEGVGEGVGKGVGKGIGKGSLAGREVKVSQSVSQRASALPAPRGQAMTDLTDRQDHEQAKNASDEETAEARDWLERWNYATGIELHDSNPGALAVATKMIAIGLTPQDAAAQIQRDGHNLAMIRGGAALQALHNIANRRPRPTVAGTHPAARTVAEGLDETSQCEHGDLRGPRYCAICRLTAARGMPA